MRAALYRESGLVPFAPNGHQGNRLMFDSGLKAEVQKRARRRRSDYGKRSSAFPEPGKLAGDDVLVSNVTLKNAISRANWFMPATKLGEIDGS